MAAEEGNYGDLGSWGLLTVKNGTTNCTNCTKDTNGGWGGTLNVGRRRAEGGTAGLGDGAHSSLKLSCPFFAKASKGLLSQKGFASRGGGRVPLSVSSIFLGFCYRESAKKFGEWCFFWRGGGFSPGEAEGTIREKLCRWCLRRLGGVPMVGGYDWDLRESEAKWVGNLRANAVRWGGGGKFGLRLSVFLR